MNLTETDWNILKLFDTVIQTENLYGSELISRFDTIVYQERRKSLSVPKVSFTELERDFMIDCFSELCRRISTYVINNGNDVVNEEDVNIDPYVVTSNSGLGRMIIQYYEIAFREVFYPKNIPLAFLESFRFHNIMNDAFFGLMLEGKDFSDKSSYRDIFKKIIDARNSFNSDKIESLLRIDFGVIKDNIENFDFAIFSIVTPRRSIFTKTNLEGLSNLLSDNATVLLFDFSTRAQKIFMARNRCIYHLKKSGPFDSKQDAIDLLYKIAELQFLGKKIVDESHFKNHIFSEGTLSQAAGRLRPALKRCGLIGLELINLNKVQGTETSYAIECSYPVVLINYPGIS